MCKTEFKHGAAQNQNTLHPCLHIGHYSLSGRDFLFQVSKGERSLRCRLTLPGSLLRLCLNQFTHHLPWLWARQRQSQSLAAFHTSDRSLITVHRQWHFIVESFFCVEFVLLLSWTQLWRKNSKVVFRQRSQTVFRWSKKIKNKNTRNPAPLMRRCGSRHKPFIKPSWRASLGLDGCAPPTHPFGDLFFFYFLFFPLQQNNGILLV